MKKIKCHSVRVANLEDISEKCYKVTAFDGSKAFIPKSQFFGHDYDVYKSDAYWFTAWILERSPNFQYSKKKTAYFSEDGKRLPDIQIEIHIPERIQPIESKADESLTR